MKRIFTTILFLVLSFTHHAYAQSSFIPQGSAIASNLQFYYQSDNGYTNPTLFLTNISNVPIQCRVTFYDHDGNELTRYARTQTGGINSWTTVNTGTTDFEIPAKGSRRHGLMPNGKIFAIVHATVEWMSEADPKLRKALVGGADIHRRDYGGGLSYSHAKIMINNGEPF
ncbi:hypothetical protein [Maridesulfovibrio sp.]|uniref:hypothetical protein n=1 Tax=Maridesulfovibrio sp. TaxID=2795000 RepID=UPI002A18ADAE|nr:hypothetical protein [Maridesulfovibrio sp.]